jgi:hypothetical protein
MMIAGCLLFGTTQSFTPPDPRNCAHRASPFLNILDAKSSACLGSSSPLFRKRIESLPQLAGLKSTANDESNEQDPNANLARKVTGLGFTAIRSSVRATTGLSLTAIRTFLRTLTGVSISRVMKSILALLPPWTRYFFQPFLILYYVPLTILKGMIGSTPTAKMEARSTHESLVQYWKDAIKSAEDHSADWPLHVMADGSMKYDLEDDRMNDKIVEAIEMKHEIEKKEASL